VEEDPRSSGVLVTTSAADVEISWATREELVKRLRRASGGQPVAQAFETAGTSHPVELDEDGKRRLLAELTFWLDNPGSAPLPSDARALFRALESERHGGPRES
jgi:hypothetical protein